LRRETPFRIRVRIAVRIARITCRNRRGDRTLVIMVAPGMIPDVPPKVSGIRYNFRCEAVTDCKIGTVTLATFIEIALGIASADFKHMAASYSEDGIWLCLLKTCSTRKCNARDARGDDARAL
jgi:hypothetical protein